MGRKERWAGLVLIRQQSTSPLERGEGVKRSEIVERRQAEKSLLR